MRIRVFAFQPFESRRGVDTVLGLRFEYDKGFVEFLKATLRAARVELRQGNLIGGWLPEQRSWFVERVAWPRVRRELERVGCTFEGPGVEDEPPRHEGHREGGRGGPPVDWSRLITRWYRELALDFHPDRGGHPEAMKAINVVTDRLRELLGVVSW